MADFLRCICPDTKAEIATSIVIDAPTLARLWGQRIQLDCCHCGTRHAFSVREAYLQHALSCAPLRSDALIGAAPGVAPKGTPISAAKALGSGVRAAGSNARSARRTRPATPAKQEHASHPRMPAAHAERTPRDGGWMEAELHFAFRAVRL